jgi:hypothetical protein
MIYIRYILLSQRRIKMIITANEAKSRTLAKRKEIDGKVIDWG